MGPKYLADFIRNNSRTLFFDVGLGLAIAFAVGAPAYAQDEEEAVPPPPSTEGGAATGTAKPAGKTEEEKVKKETVKTGVIASQVNTGSYAAIDVETSGAAPGDEASVIGASVVRKGQDECVARVNNNGENSYSISFVVEGTNARGGKSLNQYFSATIKPKGSVEKTISRCDRDLNLAVVLKSARALK